MLDLENPSEVLASSPHVFMRYTEKWVGIDDALSVDESMKAIQDDPWFVP